MINNNNLPEYFLLKQKNFESRIASRSGGAFAALSDVVLKEDGVVYGAVLTEDFTVKHVRATTVNERDRMRGSKYLQSHIGEAFRQAKDDLQQGKIVLFTGTPCQIAGLNAYLENVKYNGKLYTCDFLCHGVPSEKVFHSYLSSLEKQENSKVIAFDFRNKKKYGWADHVETIHFSDGKEIDARKWTKLFYSETIQRYSCHNCPFHSMHRPSDITLADAWEAQKDRKDLLTDDNGLTFLIINTEKGRDLFDRIENVDVYPYQLTKENCPHQLVADDKAPSITGRYWKFFLKSGFEKSYRYYVEKVMIKRIRNKVRRKLHLSSIKEKYQKLDMKSKDDLWIQTYENIDKKKEKVTLPVIYPRKNECFGCHACYDKCLNITSSITMKQDSRGFLYPVVNAATCIGCHVCERVCPFQKTKHLKDDNEELFSKLPEKLKAK